MRQTTQVRQTAGPDTPEPPRTHTIFRLAQGEEPERTVHNSSFTAGGGLDLDSSLSASTQSCGAENPCGSPSEVARQVLQPDFLSQPGGTEGSASQMGRPCHSPPAPWGQSRAQVQVCASVWGAPGDSPRHVPVPRPPCLSCADSVKRDLPGSRPLPKLKRGILKPHQMPGILVTALAQLLPNPLSQIGPLALTWDQISALASRPILVDRQIPKPCRGLFEQAMDHCLRHMPPLSDPMPKESFKAKNSLSSYFLRLRLRLFFKVKNSLKK